MAIRSRRLMASLILLSVCLVEKPEGASVAHADNRVAVTTASKPVVPFQNCSDSIKSNCIVSVKYNDSAIAFVGTAATSQSEIKCDGTNFGPQQIPSSWCYKDSAPTYAADPDQFSQARSTQSGLKILIARSPDTNRAEIPGGPSFNIVNFMTLFQPVLSSGGSTSGGNWVVNATPSQPQDSWTVKINFGPVPPPNFYAQAGIDNYVISYDGLGNTIVELKIRPLSLTYPGNGSDCKATQGTFDVTQIGLTYFRSTSPEGDSMRKVFKFTNGFAVGTNSVCETGNFRISEDGAIQIGVAANHLRSDGSLYEGYFSAVVSPVALQGFNVSPELVLRGGLRVIRAVNGNTSDLASTSEIQPDGSIRITATGFHYSSGTITVRKNNKLSLPPGKTTISSSVKTVKSGKVSRIKANIKKATGRVHVFISDAKGQKWSLGSGQIANGSVNVDVVVPRKFPKGKTSLILWYEGSRSVRPVTKVHSVIVR
jgi:hypothetical protein